MIIDLFDLSDLREKFISTFQQFGTHGSKIANSTMEAPAGGDVDRGPTIMAIMWVQAAISCIVVALRFWARITIKALGKDDWIMLCTLIKYVLVLVPINHGNC